MIRNPVIERFAISSVTEKLPLVTMIVTNFNYEEFIENCLISIRDQTYSDMECIIVDDRSTDNSVNLIRAFLENNALNDKFRLIEHTENMGQLAAFVSGYKNAKGSFITFVDADDVLLKDFVAEHIKAHLEYAAVAFTCSLAYGISKNNELRGHIKLGNFRDEPMMVPSQPFYTLQWPWSCTSSMMFRKAALDYIFISNYDSFRYCADLYLCYYSNLIGGSLLIPEVYTGYRLHDSNQFQTNPLIGNIGGIGDMRRHPDHLELLNIIRNSMIDNHDKFIALLGISVYTKLIARITPISNLLQIYKLLVTRKTLTAKYGIYFLVTGAYLNVKYHYWRLFKPSNMPKLINCNNFRRQVVKE